MIRTKARVFLAAAALCTSALVVNNCSKSKTPDNGPVTLALTVPGGISVGPVSWHLNPAGGGADILSGSFSVAGDPSTDGQVFLDLALPQGGPYTITLSAQSTGTPVRTFTGTSMAFTVVSGSQITVAVSLTDTVPT